MSLYYLVSFGHQYYFARFSVLNSMYRTLWNEGDDAHRSYGSSAPCWRCFETVLIFKQQGQPL